MNSKYTLHCADWVIPVSSSPVRDGAVVFHRQQIAAVGKTDELVRRYPDAAIEKHPCAVLTPPLANCHIHLELSHLGELSSGESPQSFTQWILSLIALRDRKGATGRHVEQAAIEVAEQQYASGVSILVDIGNTGVGTKVEKVFKGNLYAYKEYLGFHSDRLAVNLARLAAETDQTRCSAHAVYSTHTELIKALHARAVRYGDILPIHVAEPAVERVMVGDGRGEMVTFLQERGFWDNCFLDLVNGKGTVSLLHMLGVLDERTLCIHCVHVDPDEVELLAAAGAKVCLCPGSNRYLQVGKAPVKEILDAGILPALGTDSIASNPDLSLWREMEILAADHPEIPYETVFAMATRGGAEAAGLGGVTGTLSSGRRAEILKIPIPENIDWEQEVMRFLVTTGTAIQPVRIDESRRG